MSRSETRRKRREQSSTKRVMFLPNSEPEIGSYSKVHAQLLNEFTPAARKVMVLILLGLNRDEICSVLNLSSTAFRQRLSTIRKALKKLPHDLQREALALAYQQKKERAEELAIGLIRRALHRLLQQEPGIGTHDPDGHLLILKSR